LQLREFRVLFTGGDELLFHCLSLVPFYAEFLAGDLKVPVGII
jgi:hypothetical protein